MALTYLFVGPWIVYRCEAGLIDDVATSTPTFVQIENVEKDAVMGSICVLHMFLKKTHLLPEIQFFSS